MVLFPKHIFALFKRKEIMLMKRKTDKYTHCKRYEGKTTGRKIMDYHLKYSLAHSLRRDSALNRITTVQHKTIQHNMPLYILQSGTYLLQGLQAGSLGMYPTRCTVIFLCFYTTQEQDIFGQGRVYMKPYRNFCQKLEVQTELLQILCHFNWLDSLKGIFRVKYNLNSFDSICSHRKSFWHIHQFVQ